LQLLLIGFTFNAQMKKFLERSGCKQYENK